MKIVYIGRYNEGEILSGPEKTAKRIFELSSKENSVSFIQYFFDGNKYGLFKKLFGKQQQEVNNSIIYTAGLFRILLLLFKREPEIIHIVTFERFAVISLLIKIFKKVKIVYSSHGVVYYENSEIKNSSLFYTFKDKICERLLLKYSDLILFPSEQALDISKKYFKFSERKIKIIANGIDDGFRDHRKDKNGTMKGVIMNLSAYRSSGITFLNNILNSLNCSLEIYSIGKYNEITVSAPDVRIIYSDKMTAKELINFYLDKNIFFALNSYDTFSISAVEAVSAGLIPIVTAQTGMSRFIINCENGYIVEYGDRETASKIITALSQNSDLIRKMSAECSKIFSILSWDEVYGSYKNIYESLS